MREERAGKGFFVSTGTFTSTAEAYASKYNIELINIDKLALLMQEAYPDSGSIDTIKIMCLECGQVLSAPLKKSVGKCGNGHIVKNDLDLASISQGAHTSGSNMTSLIGTVGPMLYHDSTTQKGLWKNGEFDE